MIPHAQCTFKSLKAWCPEHKHCVWPHFQTSSHTTVIRCIADLSLTDAEMWSTYLEWTFDLSSQWKLNLSKKCRKKRWSTHLCVFPIFCFSFSLLLFLLLFLFRCLLFSKLFWTRFLFFYILVHNICWSIIFLFTLRIFIRLPIIYIQLKGESYQLLG